MCYFEILREGNDVCVDRGLVFAGLCAITVQQNQTIFHMYEAVLIRQFGFQAIDQKDLKAATQIIEGVPGPESAETTFNMFFFDLFTSPSRFCVVVCFINCFNRLLRC